MPADFGAEIAGVGFVAQLDAGDVDLRHDLPTDPARGPAVMVCR